MSQFETGLRLSLASAFALSLMACSPQAPIDNGKASNGQNSSNGTDGLQPVAGTPEGGAPGTLPPPGAAPPPGNSPPSGASCAAASSVTWMVQDTSFRIDYLGSPEQRSHLCQGTLPETAVGSTAMATSVNGTSGVLMYTCQSVNGTPTWQHGATYDQTTGEPINVSCGIYTSTYRPKNSGKIAYRFHESRTPDAQNQMYGLNMIVRSFLPRTVDHLFSRTLTEGPDNGYILEGVGFSTVHLAATQDLGRTISPAAPAGLQKVFRCYSPTRSRHYVIASASCESGTDILEGSAGYLFTSPNVPASGSTLIPVYRCKTNIHDLATTSLAECNSVSGTTTVLGYTMQ